MENMEFEHELILERSKLDNLFIDMDSGRLVEEMKLFSVISEKTLYYNTSNDPLFNDLDDIRRIELNYAFKSAKLIHDHRGSTEIYSDMSWYLRLK